MLLGSWCCSGVGDSATHLKSSFEENLVLPTCSIRNLEINPGLVLAPMSGVTTSAFRRFIKELNPGHVGLVVSEFISVEGLTRDSKRSLEMMRFHPEEHPVGIQIFGWDIERMKAAAQMVESAGADVLDINCGCPAPKVVKRGGGCELMRQPDHLAKIFRAVRAAVRIPVTMKMRSGWDESSKNCVEIAKIAEGEGLEGITVHGRTRAELYRGVADWGWISKVSAAVKVPVFGSGDVVDRASAMERLNSGARGLYIGRAALYNPLVFSEIVSGETHQVRDNLCWCLAALARYRALLLADSPAVSALGKLKQLASQLIGNKHVRVQLLRARSLSDYSAVLEHSQEDARGTLLREPFRSSPTGGTLLP